MFGVPERSLRDCRDSSYFLRFAKNHTSQGGEDGILDKLFQLIGTTDRPYCVDIGAWDGQHLSNTYQLINELKWGGLLVEANSERYATLCALYAARPDVTCIDCLVDIEGDSSLNIILQKQKVPLDLDFVSIDVDGADYHLWHTIGESYKPRVMCIEFNPTIPNHVHYVQERDIAIQEGSSLLALTELGRSFGYHLVVTTTFNAIFVRHDLMDRIPQHIFTYLPVAGAHKLALSEFVNASQSEGHSLERVVDLNSLHNCSMATDIFQTYSGELKLCGPKKLMWHRVSMNIQQMQAIKPKKDRVFPFAPPYAKTISSLEICMRKVVAALRIVQHSPTVEIKCHLTDLFDQCTDVYGITGSSAQSTATLKSICKEIWLNAVMMVMIVYRDATAGHSTPTLSSETGNVLYSYLASSAINFELMGDQYVQMGEGGKGSSNTAGAGLQEGKEWLQRALHVTTFLSTHPVQGTKLNELAASVARLSRKLSATALQSVAAPVWVQSLREPTACEGVVEESIGVVQSSVEDIDDFLRGMFWRELAAVGTNTVADGDVEERAELRKLDKKWRSKVLWAEAREPSELKNLCSHEKKVVQVEANKSREVCFGLGILLGCIVGGAAGYFVAKAVK